LNVVVFDDDDDEEEEMDEGNLETLQMAPVCYILVAEIKLFHISRINHYIPYVQHESGALNLLNPKLT
jgi:hypothetical protein